MCRIAVVAAALMLCGCATFTPAAQSESFTVVLLPDTQNYSQKFPETYLAQTEWIKQRVKPDNVRFVIHLGDIVQTARRETEWKVADKAHRILDGVVPYSMVPGNHDMDWKNGNLTYGTRFYDKYFPPERYKKYPWYGGHIGKNNTNNYCYFEGGGVKFMVLSLEFAPRDETLEWASKVVKAHKDRKVILVTHYYLRPQGRPDDTKPYGLPGNVGEKLWNKFVRRHTNIFMVVCGHVAGVHNQTSVNDAGKKVHEILCDYQTLPNGGDGWLQSLRFVPSENKIHVEAYSPVLDKHNKDLKHTYTLEYNVSEVRLRKAG